MQLLNGIPLPLALLLWAFNILSNPLAIGSCPKGHITRHKPIVKKGLTDLPSIETLLKYLHWVGLETCLNYYWNSERSEEPQTSLKEAVLMSWLSQTWEMKWFSSIGKSWSCTIKSEFCSMHLVERDIICDLFGWQRFQWQNYSVQDFLVMGNLNPANGDFGISESGVSWKYWKDFNKNRELVIIVKPNNRFADKKSPLFRVLCCSNVYNKYWMAEWALKARKDIPDTHCYAKEADSLVAQTANHNCWISANLPDAALAFCLMICSVENNQDIDGGDDHNNRNGEEVDCNSRFALVLTLSEFSSQLVASGWSELGITEAAPLNT